MVPVGNDALTAIIAVIFTGPVTVWLTRKFDKAAAQEIVMVAQDVVHVASDALGHVPAVKETETHLQEELERAIDKVKETTLGKLAAEAIGGVQKMGKEFPRLSPQEQDAIALHIAMTAKAVGFDFSRKEIQNALDVAEQASATIAYVPVISAAVKFAEEIANVGQHPSTLASA